jgi:FKBP-type peptidyl-prolyl cis-trans isomerase
MLRTALGLAFVAWVAVALLVAGCRRKGGGATTSMATSNVATAAAAEASPGTNVAALGDDAQFPEGTEVTESGLRMLVLRPGVGTDHPAESDRVRVHFTGWTKNGTMFDSSKPQGQPILFTLTQMIPGWTEALKLMVPGEKRKLWIPAHLAYGESPPEGTPAGDLTYEIELTEIIHAPQRPEDVAGMPKTATVTASGLAYRLLSAGTGKVHAKASDTVVASYSGWTTDGLLFDSSRLRDGPGTFTVHNLIKGWREGLQLMVVGDKMRFWMPSNLAYGDHPTQDDTPAGMLVFDIELLDIR